MSEEAGSRGLSGVVDVVSRKRLVCCFMLFSYLNLFLLYKTQDFCGKKKIFFCDVGTCYPLLE